MTVIDLMYFVSHESPWLVFSLLMLLIALTYCLATENRLWLRRFLFVFLPPIFLAKVRRIRNASSGHESPSSKVLREYVDSEINHYRALSQNMDRSRKAGRRAADAK